MKNDLFIGHIMQRHQYLFSILAVLAIMIFITLPAPAYELKTHDEIAGFPDLKVDAKQLKRTIVTPHMEQKIIPDTNILWCSTFQLAWNELCELTGGPIEMKSTSPMVRILNRKGASKNDLDEESYVAMAGLKNEGIVDKIRKQLNLKFNGQAVPALLDNVSTSQMTWVAYAYLFKELPFKKAFYRFHGELNFDGDFVDSFGIEQFQNDDMKLASQVNVLYYKDNDNLIIELKPETEEDRIILAKVSPRDSLASTLKMVETRIETSTPSQLRDLETLFIPVLNFDILRRYTEVSNLPIQSANDKINGTKIEMAVQSIRFRLDERGAVLKSEVALADSLMPRSFIFDKPFMIMLMRKGAKTPYFLLWVGNSELLVHGKNNNM